MRPQETPPPRTCLSIRAGADAMELGLRRRAWPRAWDRTAGRAGDFGMLLGSFCQHSLVGCSTNTILLFVLRVLSNARSRVHGACLKKLGANACALRE